MDLLGSLMGLLGSLMKLLGAMDDPVAGKHSCGEIGCPGMGKTVVYRRKLLASERSCLGLSQDSAYSNPVLSSYLGIFVFEEASRNNRDMNKLRVGERNDSASYFRLPIKNGPIANKDYSLQALRCPQALRWPASLVAPSGFRMPPGFMTPASTSRVSANKP